MCPVDQTLPILTGKPGGSRCCRNSRSLLNCLNGAMTSRMFSNLLHQNTHMCRWYSSLSRSGMTHFNEGLPATHTFKPYLAGTHSPSLWQQEATGYIPRWYTTNGCLTNHIRCIFADYQWAKLPHFCFKAQTQIHCPWRVEAHGNNCSYFCYSLKKTSI